MWKFIAKPPMRNRRVAHADHCGKLHMLWKRRHDQTPPVERQLLITLRGFATPVLEKLEKMGACRLPSRLQGGLPRGSVRRPLPATGLTYHTSTRRSFRSR